MQAGSRNKGNRHGLAWFRVVILVIAWLMIYSLAQDVWQTRVGFSRIAESKRRLVAEENKNLELKERLEVVMTDDYREKLIREKLNMQKEGEVIVVMPKQEAKKDKDKISAESQANWQRWGSLIK